MTTDTFEQLRGLLVIAYARIPEAEMMADMAGIARGTLPIDQPNMRSWWWAAIHTLWRQGKLVELLDATIKDPTIAALPDDFARLRDPVLQLQEQLLAGKPVVVISYSHKDEGWKDRLGTQLMVLQKAGLLDAWDDRRIGAGEDWRPAIRSAMDSATVAVLLISVDYLTSDFILDEEVPRLLERRKSEGLHVFPVIVRPCAWKHVSWLSAIQARPKDGRPLSSVGEAQAEEDLAAIADEIADIIIARAGAQA